MNGSHQKPFELSGSVRAGSNALRGQIIITLHSAFDTRRGRYSVRTVGFCTMNTD